MIISANELTILQSCARRAVIEREYRIRKWRPRALFNRCLADLVLAVSGGQDATRAGVEAYIKYLQSCKDPGLDLAYGVSPFVLAMDFAVALRVTAELLSRLTLPVLRIPQDVVILKGYDYDYLWRPGSLEDEGGNLHHWHAIEKFDKGTLVEYGHSWRWGDMAACNAPLTLHLVEIGFVRHGHLHGDLTRIFEHPSVAKYKFQHVDGKELLTGWKARWLQDLGEKVMPNKRWCDILTADRVEPIHHVPLKQPEEWQREEFVNEVTYEMDRLEALQDWRHTPKSRGACDILGGCPHQVLCYGPEGATPQSVGGYVPR